MTDFAIDPPVRILGRRGGFVRSTEQAAAFMREHMLQHTDSPSTEVLRRLEDVRSAEEAQEAAQAFRAWIASGLVATPRGISTKSHALDRSKKVSVLSERAKSPEALVGIGLLSSRPLPGKL
jgi:hypothetical protein